MKVLKSKRGFTLIELLLVIGIVAIILAVIVPMGLRANIDAKYGTVRQNCSELASFASQWVEKSILAQDEEQSRATVKDYYSSLAGGESAADTFTGQWIAVNDEENNWNLGNPAEEGGEGDFPERNPIAITGRSMNNESNQPPEDVVEDIIPRDKAIRNPFNEVNVFRSPNYPTADPINGAIAFGGMEESDPNWFYFAFAFQGTDSDSIEIEEGDDDNTFHAGMGLDSIAKLRNGVFAGRFR